MVKWGFNFDFDLIVQLEIFCQKMQYYFFNYRLKGEKYDKKIRFKFDKNNQYKILWNHISNTKTFSWNFNRNEIDMQ